MSIDQQNSSAKTYGTIFFNVGLLSATVGFVAELIRLQVRLNKHAHAHIYIHLQLIHT